MVIDLCDQKPMDLLEVESGVSWGWRSISLYTSEAIPVYQIHLGGVETLPGRAAVELRDGMVIGEEKVESPRVKNLVGNKLDKLCENLCEIHCEQTHEPA